MADQPADYRQLGITQATIAPWEDGFRTEPGGSGTFEWWYVDAILADGSTLVINFMDKDFRSPGGINRPASPVVTLELDRPDGSHIERTSRAFHHDYAFATDSCDVRVGPNFIAGDLRTYRIHADIDGVMADLTLIGEVPPWRPETGHLLFGDGSAYFAWLPPIPRGRLEATLAIDGVTETLTGTGYHDHNWGNAEMVSLMHHWYWARAEVDDYTVIAAHITATKKFGYTEVPVFMLAKAGEIIADRGKLVRFSKADEQPDPVTGKPVANTVVYDYDASDGGESYRITFRRESTIVRNRMIETIKGPKRMLAHLTGFDGAYLRFTGQVTIEHRDTDGTTIDTATAPGLWELMYFGKNTS
jgi:hypothetical protein